MAVRVRLGEKQALSASMEAYRCGDEVLIHPRRLLFQSIPPSPT